MATAILEAALPEDLVCDISRRVHRLNLSAVLEAVRDPRRLLESLPPLATEEWSAILPDGDDVECVSTKSSVWSYPYFAREVKRVVHVDAEAVVGQMDWGAWFVYRAARCFLAEDARDLAAALPEI